MRGRIVITVVAVGAADHHRRGLGGDPAAEETVRVDPSVTLRTPGLLVRDTETGHLAVVEADGHRAQSKAECARAYAAAGRAVCLFRDWVRRLSAVGAG